jgi:hypothetical protein
VSNITKNPPRSRKKDLYANLSIPVDLNEPQERSIIGLRSANQSKTTNTRKDVNMESGEDIKTLKQNHESMSLLDNDNITTHKDVNISSHNNIDIPLQKYIKTPLRKDVNLDMCEDINASAQIDIKTSPDEDIKMAIYNSAQISSQTHEDIFLPKDETASTHKDVNLDLHNNVDASLQQPVNTVFQNNMITDPNKDVMISTLIKPRTQKIKEPPKARNTTAPEGTKRFNFNIRNDLHSVFKTFCFVKNIDMVAIAEPAIMLYLDILKDEKYMNAFKQGIQINQTILDELSKVKK